MIRVRCDGHGARQAARVIGRGGIAVFPTDTVYGIGCNPYLVGAIDRVYGAKSRDRSKPLPVLAGSAAAAGALAILDGAAGELAARFWPGALTIVAELRDKRLASTMGIGEKIAVRVPASSCAQRLLSEAGPLVGTSANLSGRAPFTDPRDFPAGLDADIFVDGGATGGAAESTIVEVVGGDVKVLREGALGAGEILGA